MTEIAITPMEPEHYGVQVTEGDVTTSYRVALPADVLDDLALTDLDEERIVEETVRYLLDREPATNVPHELSIADVPAQYPDFYDELRVRVAPR